MLLFVVFLNNVKDNASIIDNVRNRLLFLWNLFGKYRDNQQVKSVRIYKSKTCKLYTFLNTCNLKHEIVFETCIGHYQNLQIYEVRIQKIF